MLSITTNCILLTSHISAKKLFLDITSKSCRQYHSSYVYNLYAHTHKIKRPKCLEKDMKATRYKSSTDIKLSDFAFITSATCMYISSEKSIIKKRRARNINSLMPFTVENIFLTLHTSVIAALENLKKVERLRALLLKVS